MKTFYAHIYIGTCYGYSKDKFTKSQLIAGIKRFMQNDMCSVRVTDTTFIAGEYQEDGYEITMINYPRFPQEEMVIQARAIRLAKYLLETFQQNRMTLVFPDETMLIESSTAVEHPPQLSDSDINPLEQAQRNTLLGKIEGLEVQVENLEHQLQIANQLIEDHKKFFGFKSLSDMAYIDAPANGDVVWKPCKTETAIKAMQSVINTMWSHLQQ